MSYIQDPYDPDTEDEITPDTLPSPALLLAPVIVGLLLVLVFTLI